MLNSRNKVVGQDVSMIKKAAVRISVPSLSCCGPQYYSRQAGIERKPDELPDIYVSIPHGGFRIHVTPPGNQSESLVEPRGLYVVVGIDLPWRDVFRRRQRHEVMNVSFGFIGSADR